MLDTTLKEPSHIKAHLVFAYNNAKTKNQKSLNLPTHQRDY